MNEKPVFGPDPERLLNYAELPIGATATGFDPNLMRTGAWRFYRPVQPSQVSPCNAACPAGVEVRGVIQLIKEGAREDAASLYLNENPFPAICGRVCFHPCETDCSRRSFDGAVAINRLEHLIGEHACFKAFDQKENGKTVAVIGSGPAGLSCAYFSRRLGYSVKVFEKLAKPGGMLRYGIPEYRLPKRILDREIERLTEMGIHIETGKELGRNLTLDELRQIDALFVATGAHVSEGSDLRGAKEEGVHFGLDFLKKVASRQIKTFRGKVAVIGGGNTAVDVARTILRLGGRPTIYYRRSREEMPAMESEVLDCEEEGIAIRYLTAPVKILTARDRVKGVEFVANRLGKFDESKRRRTVPIKGSNFRVAVEAVVLAMGESPDLSPFLDLVKTQSHRILTNEFGQTGVSKIFAGGDIVHQERTVVHAIGSGKRAAIGMDCYLKGISPHEINSRLRAISTGGQKGLSFIDYLRHRDSFPLEDIPKRVVDVQNMNPLYFSPQKRGEPPKTPVRRRINNFEEIRKGFSPKEARKEASRCLSCGLCNACGNCFIFCPDTSVFFEEGHLKSQVNYDYCKGCGICVNECPTGAMVLVKEG